MNTGISLRTLLASLAPILCWSSLASDGLPPVIVVQPESRTVHSGPVYFSVEACGGYPLSYQWRQNGIPLSNVTNDDFYLYGSLTSADYDVIVSNPFGSVTSAVAHITLSGLAPSIEYAPTSQYACSGGTAWFWAGVYGASPLSAQWQFNGVDLPGATNGLLVLTNVSTAQAGPYVLVLSNAYGTLTSAVVTLTVDPAEPVVLRQPRCAAVLEGYSTSFEVEAFGCAPLTYQWRHNGADLPRATNSTLWIVDAGSAAAGAYEVVVTGGSSSTTSAVVNLVVGQQSPIIGCQPVSATVPFGTNVTFSTCASGVPAPSFQWLHEGQAIPGATNNALHLTAVGTNDAGDYSVIACNPAGAATSSVARLTVLVSAPVILRQPQSQAVAIGNSVSFDVSASAVPPPAYQWRFGGQPIAGATRSTLSFAATSTTQAGNYKVVISNFLGVVTSAVATLVVTQWPPVILDQPEDATVVAGGAVTFYVEASAAPPPTYQWRFNGKDMPGATKSWLALYGVSPSQSGRYKVVVRNALGAVTSAVAVLTVNVTPPQFWSEPASLEATLGEPVTFQGGASAPATPTYQWLFNERPVAGANNDRLRLSAARFSDAGNYALVASNEGGAVTSRVATLSVFEPSHLDHWAWRRPLPQGNDLFAVAHGNGVWAAVGRRGARVFSTDGGATWQAANQGSVTLRRLAYGNGRFVAVGEDRYEVEPRLQVSTDGKVWEDRPLPVGPGVDLTDIAFGKTRDRLGRSVGGFVVIGSDGVVLHSIDGLQWEQQALDTNVWLAAIAWAGDRFLVLSTEGLVFSSLDGRRWTRLPSSFMGPVSRLAYGNGWFVACCKTFLSVYPWQPVDFFGASFDGVTWWTSPLLPFSLHDVTFDGQQFVVAGWNWQASEDMILTSPDGQEWTEYTTGSSNGLFGIASADGRWVAVGNRGTILVASDRMNWVTRSSGNPVNLRDVAYGDRRYVAVGNEGLVLTSTDGVTWRKQTNPTTNNLRGIAFAQGRFVAVGEEGAQGGTILTTSNGVTWARQPSPTPRGLYSVVSGPDQFVAVGDEGVIVSSVDGLAWSSQSSGVSKKLNSVTWGSGLYVAVGRQGTIVYSSDGLAWNRASRPSNQTAYLQGVAAGNHVFVAAGQGGTLLVSTNGTEWTNQPSPFEWLDIEDVLFANNRFILVGESGLIATSRDGRIWRRRASPCANDLRGVTFADGSFVAVGNNKTILQSDRTPVPLLRALGLRRPEGFALQLEGEEGQMYRLEASDDLKQWNNLRSVSKSPGSPPLLDTNAASYRQRFYRVVAP